MKTVTIVGGGVIGLASAYYLRKMNYEVIVVDRNELDQGCSNVNQGWICPSLSEPVPAPGLVGTSVKWLLRKDSPLYVKPTMLLPLSSWLFQFMRHCNEEDFTKGYKAGLDMGRHTFELFDQLAADGVKFDMYKDGLLYVSMNEEALEHKMHGLKITEAYGLPKAVRFSSNEVLKREPELSGKVAGGVLMPAERHVRPESLLRGLYDWLVENGVKVLFNTEVTDIVRNQNRVEAIKCGGRTIAADNFLIATGAWSAELSKKIGYSFPITGGKGYSITIESPNIRFKQPLYLGDTRAAITPFHDSVRIGGTMEMSGLDEKMDMRRVDGIRSAVSHFFKSGLRGTSEKVSAGFRPMTPDGLPVIGQVPGLDNAFIATGHSMNGVSMALDTGTIISHLISGNAAKIDMNMMPFSPSRFS